MTPREPDPVERLTRMALFFWAVGFVTHLLLARPWAAVACVLPILGLGLARSLPRRALVFALGSNVLGIFVVSGLTGGASAPTLLFLPTFAVAAGLLADRKQAGAWMILAVLGVASLAVADALHLTTGAYEVLPHEVAADLVLASASALLVGWRARVIVMRLASENQKRAEAAEEQAKNLAEARARAEQLVERRAAFLATVSHELRTPLGAVIGLTHVLDSPTASPEQRELLQTLRTSADSLRLLVDDLLDHESMDRGMLKVEQGVVTPRTTVAEVCGLFQGTASAKGLTLRWSVDRALPVHVRGDALRLRQVLSNLVSNAVKYTSQGSIDVRARPETDPDGSAVLVLEVKDTGPGIDAAARSLLFLPFERTGSEAARQTSGTGLGLSLGRRLAEAMGGTLDVESEPGHGATFRLRLPCVSETLPEERSLDGASAPLPELSKLDVLIVDDEPINRRVASLLLSRMGHRPTDVPNAQSALEIVRAQPFDVILLDYQMPEMDGPELARALAAVLPKPAATMIGLTASVSEDTRRACLDAGMVFVLAKPIDIAQLTQVLERVSRRRTPGGPVASVVKPA